MPLSVNIGGANKAMADGWVNIGGIWKKIDSIHTNIDGTWRAGHTSISYLARVGDALYLSSDLATWSQVGTLKLPGTTVRGFAYSSTYKRMAVWYASSTYYTSNDFGVTWTARSVRGTYTNMGTGTGRLLSYSDTSSLFYYSLDFVNWSSFDYGEANYNKDMSAVHYVDGVWFMVRYSSVASNSTDIYYNTATNSNFTLKHSGCGTYGISKANETLYISWGRTGSTDNDEGVYYTINNGTSWTTWINKDGDDDPPLVPSFSYLNGIYTRRQNTYNGSSYVALGYGTGPTTFTSGTIDLGTGTISVYPFNGQWFWKDNNARNTFKLSNDLVNWTTITNNLPATANSSIYLV